MATCVVSSNESAYHTFIRLVYFNFYVDIWLILSRYFYQNIVINGMVGMVADVEIPTEVPHNVAEIVLVRHGETTWNNAGRIQGSLELGKELKPAAIYSSDLKRAKNTAEMIAKTCHIPEVVEVPDLKERHVGSLQGYYWSEIQEKEPEAYLAFFSSIRTLKSSERVIVVTHGGILRAIYMAVTGESRQGKILNASINVVHLTEKKWVFKTWSDVSHLNEVGFLQRGFNGDAIQH
ncbi:hypothetical protein MKW92_037709 [Papaver armeniacum]|nr:hypothetical protein MKW92_037709 [Papaver armeniacum]